MSANLTSEMNNTNKVVVLINECRKLNIKVHAPDINKSGINFKPLNDKEISFGLNAVKNVGIKALEQCIEVRNKHGKFKSIFDFTSKVDQRLVNKKVLVPTYRTQYDTSGLRILREAMPGYEVVGIDCDDFNANIISLGGAIHCITKEIGASDPLLISHQQVLW